MKKMHLKLPRIRLPSTDKAYDWLSELAMLAGFFMLGYGIWLIYHPAMWIICGVILLLFGFPRKGGGK